MNDREAAQLGAQAAFVFDDFRKELATQGLPETATLADLIRHHRGNAGAAAAFESIARESIPALAEAHYRTYVPTKEHPAWEDLKPHERTTLIERMHIAVTGEETS